MIAACRTLAAIAAAALAVAAAAVHAQVQAPSPARKELAAKVAQLQAAGVENIGRVIAGRTSQQVWQVSSQALARVPADKREATARDVQAEIKKFHDEIEPILKKRAGELAAVRLAAAYEERFSDDELKQVIAWLESPTSRKFAQFDAEQGNALAEKVVAETRPAIEPKLKALEASLAKRMGLPVAGAASAPRK